MSALLGTIPLRLQSRCRHFQSSSPWRALQPIFKRHCEDVAQAKEIDNSLSMKDWVEDYCSNAVMQGNRRVAANIAGGTHHAMGRVFVSVFNDIAVASAICLRDYPTKCNLQAPILVVDLDVHQGNDTSKLFENDDRVITFDMHGAGNYPWKSKTKSNYDIGLPDDTGDEAYLATLAEWLPHLIELHEPSLVLFQAGVDALKEDSFGRLAMTRQGLLKRNNMVYSACIERNLPLVITMGGDHSRPSDASIEAHADVYRSAALRYSAAQVPLRVRK